MASGDLTASTPQKVTSPADMKTHIDGLNLNLATDTLHIIPFTGRDHSWLVCKVEREA